MAPRTPEEIYGRTNVPIDPPEPPTLHLALSAREACAVLDAIEAYLERYRTTPPPRSSTVREWWQFIPILNYEHFVRHAPLKYPEVRRIYDRLAEAQQAEVAVKDGEIVDEP
jgi:hypothetical protein